MSCNAWMGCTITVLKNEYEEKAREWAEAARADLDGDNCLTLFIEWESAGWFENALEYLKDDLASLPLPLDAWMADARYEYFDDPQQDGSFVEFTIENGKITRCEESRITMVECDPWFKFDMTEEEV